MVTVGCIELIRIFSKPLQTLWRVPGSSPMTDTVQQTVVAGMHSGYSGVFPLCYQNVYDKNANYSCKACKCTWCFEGKCTVWIPCSNFCSPLFPSAMDSCNSSFVPSAHCTSDCIRKLLQRFLLCTELDLFVCSAAKCKTFSSWGKFHWGSSSGPADIWDSDIVPCCTRG